MSADGPTFDFQAGGSNHHYGRIGHWLATILARRFPGCTVNLKVGNRYRDIDIVGEGGAHLGVVTPGIAARQCLLGQALYRRAHPELRSIGVVPHRDALVLGVAADLDVGSIEEIRERRIPMRLAAPLDQSSVAYAGRRILEQYGLTPAFLEECGGQWIDIESAQAGWKLVATRQAEAMLQESITNAFRPLSRARPIRLLSFREDVVERLATEEGYEGKTVPPGTVVGQEEPVLGLNWDHWIVVAHASLPEDAAYALADGFLTDWERLARQYTADNRLPREDHPLEYPMRPEVVSREVSVPLHPGAEARYRESGLL